MTVAERPRIIRRRPGAPDGAIATADEVRRRIERDLHDGAQQRFVAAALHLRIARAQVADGRRQAAALDRGNRGSSGPAWPSCGSLARGIDPAVLTDHGLEPAIEALAGRTPLPVACFVDLPGAPGVSRSRRPPTSWSPRRSRTSSATRARRSPRCALHIDGRRLVIEVRDDGAGGADLRTGSGLRGLADRVGALDGSLRVEDAQGGGTVVHACVPLV